MLFDLYYSELIIKEGYLDGADQQKIDRTWYRYEWCY